MKKRGKFDEKIQYWIESFLGKGTFTMIFLLFMVAIIFTCVVGIIATLIGGGNLGVRIWDGLMHTLDSGILAGDPLDDKVNLVFMTIMTIFGLCFTSVLIGIVNSSFEKKLHEMRLGTTKVIEENHVVVLGYNYTIFKIVGSLVEANSNHFNQCVVVVGDKKTEVMLETIKSHVGKMKGTRLICRSGKTYEEYMLKRANVEKARTVIINEETDDQSLRTLLAFIAYIKKFEEKEEKLKKKSKNKSNDKLQNASNDDSKKEHKNRLFNDEIYATVVFHDEKYVNAAQKYGGYRVRVINENDIVSRLIARASNQRGLCGVFDEVLDYYNYEIYCEKIRELKEDKDYTFKEILHMFDKQIPIGYIRDGKVKINPKMNRIIKNTDEIILFEEDDGKYTFSEKEIQIDNSVINISKEKNYIKSELIIMGQNERLLPILLNYNRNTKIIDRNEKANVKVIDTKDKLALDKNDYAKLNSLNLKYKHIDEFSSENIKDVLKGKTDFNIVILTDDDLDFEEADSLSFLKLIELNKIAEETHNDFSITCEIRKKSNQKLAETIRPGNFVVGSNIGGLLSVQYAENPRMNVIFEDLLNSKGSELYMKPVENFIKLDREVNFATILEAGAREESVILGFRWFNPKTQKIELKTGIKREESFTFHEGDTFIVLSEDPV